MDFRLRVFLSVAKHLSFTKASKEMGVSQPAITKHIQELENMYGVQLLGRQGGKAGLTHHGKILQEYAERIVQEHGLLRLEMGLPGEGVQGDLNILSDFKVAGTIVAGLIPEFMEKFQDVNLRMEVVRDPHSCCGNKADLILVAAQDVSDADTIKILHREDVAPQAQVFIRFISIYMGRQGVEISSAFCP